MGMSISEARGNLLFAIRWKERPTDESMELAIEVMRKYQKIEEIVTQWQNETDPKIKFARSNMEKIKKVIEDGKD